MVRFGICTQEQYLRLGEGRRDFGAHVAYSLLDVGEQPSEEQIRAFEDISFRLRTSNGIFRTSFAQRFRDVDEAALAWMQRLFSRDAAIRIQDRAASHALTSQEWAERIFHEFPQAVFEASDLLLELVEISRGTEAFIVEPGGRAIQFVRRPFAVSLAHLEPRRYPVNRLVASWARRRFERLGLRGSPVERMMENAEKRGWRVRRISYVHPRARQFARSHPQFQVRVRNVFEVTPGDCDVIRTMNIFNPSYFSAEQLREGIAAVWNSLRPNGLWVAGRTREEDFSNHATLFRRRENDWEALQRIGEGAEIEQLLDTRR